MSVYVVQQRHRRLETASGTTLVPTINLDPAKKFGDIKIIFPDRRRHDNMSREVETAKKALENFDSFNDYILLLSDQLLCAITVAVASNIAQGPIRLLAWDRDIGDYLISNIDLRGVTYDK